MSDLSYFIIRNEGDPDVTVNGTNGIYEKIPRGTEHPFFVKGGYSVRIHNRVILSVKFAQDSFRIDRGSAAQDGTDLKITLSFH